MSAIKINCVTTREAIGQIRSALGTDLENLFIKFTKESMKIGATSRSLALVIDVPDCSGKGEFGINAESFQRVLDKRKVLTCELDDSRLSFSENRFKGELTIFPYIKVEVTPEESEKAIRIPPDSGVAQHFNASRSHLSLKDPLMQDKEPFLAVMVKDGKIDCLVYGPLHAGLYSSPIDYKGTIEFNIQDSTLRKISSIMKKDSVYTMLIGESSVFVESENVRASISMTQASGKEAKPFLELMNRLQKKENVLASALIPVDGLSKVVNNMMGIVEAQKVIDLRIKKDQLAVKYITSYGRISETFETSSKGEEEISLTPDILLDILDVVPDGKANVMITKHPDSKNKMKQLLITIPEEHLTYVMVVK